MARMDTSGRAVRRSLPELTQIAGGALRDKVGEVWALSLSQIEETQYAAEHPCRFMGAQICWSR